MPKNKKAIQTSLARGLTGRTNQTTLPNESISRYKNCPFCIVDHFQTSDLLSQVPNKVSLKN
jgi:hypothetical protein